MTFYKIVARTDFRGFFWILKMSDLTVHTKSCNFGKYYKTLKGVFTKNERGYMASVEKYSIVIYTNLSSICCVYRRKLLKTNHTEVNSVHSIQIWKISIFNSDPKKKLFDSKQIIQILQPIIIIFRRIREMLIFHKIYIS